ncbi:Hypothetical predicted protein [Olea europaea subsp. europaea]|uniref:Uncharacterized protein n=1 Tax=Olea europaea subsp. europaea TaxID=158383 RepID=A0A8S0RB37_OLEEU|nr:Hypothetical predicted protein [Olea europaea subsp. europaea]
MGAKKRQPAARLSPDGHGDASRGRGRTNKGLRRLDVCLFVRPFVFSGPSRSSVSFDLARLGLVQLGCGNGREFLQEPAGRLRSRDSCGCVTARFCGMNSSQEPRWQEWEREPIRREPPGQGRISQIDWPPANLSCRSMS